MKKLLISILISLTFLMSLAPFSQAKAQDSTWYNQSIVNWYTKVYDQNISPSQEIFGERYTAAQVQWVVYGLFSTLWNVIPGNPELTVCLMGGTVENCLTSLPEVVKDVLFPTASFPTGSNLASTYINTVTSNSLSGVGYFKKLVQKLSPVSVVKAQVTQSGIGFSFAGSSMATLWKVTRNISFTLLVIAIVVMSFMIMFRVKISPQAVITIQSALPKLIITLILITFSYAIAGLMIDAMYLVIGFLATAFSAGGLSQLSPADLFAALVAQYDGFGVIYTYWVHFVASSFMSIFGSGGSFWIGIFVLLFAVVTIFAMLWWSIKIVWVMIKNFALLMLTIVLGPLEIMMGVITKSSGFGSWLKKLATYIIFYPVLIVMMFLSFFFLNQGRYRPDGTPSPESGLSMPFSPTVNVIGANYWSPPFSIATSHNSGNTQLIWVLVSFFIFSQITKVAEIVQSFFSGKPFDYGSAIGEATGAVKSVWGQTGAPYLKSAQEIYSRARLGRWQTKLQNKFNNPDKPQPTDLGGTSTA